jgi:hypothetical protein
LQVLARSVDATLLMMDSFAGIKVPRSGSGIHSQVVFYSVFLPINSVIQLIQWFLLLFGAHDRILFTVNRILLLYSPLENTLHPPWSFSYILYQMHTDRVREDWTRRSGTSALRTLISGWWQDTLWNDRWSVELRSCESTMILQTIICLVLDISWTNRPQSPQISSISTVSTISINLHNIEIQTKGGLKLYGFLARTCCDNNNRGQKWILCYILWQWDPSANFVDNLHKSQQKF